MHTVKKVIDGNFRENQTSVTEEKHGKEGKGNKRAKGRKIKGEKINEKNSENL